MRTRVYIAGPMSRGDRIANLAAALTAYRELVALGYSPMAPQLSYFIAEVIPQTHAEWLDIDIPWVSVADAVLRLPGESEGADEETEAANYFDVPVYHSLAELVAAVPAQSPFGEDFDDK